MHAQCTYSAWAVHGQCMGSACVVRVLSMNRPTEEREVLRVGLSAAGGCACMGMHACGQVMCVGLSAVSGARNTQLLASGAQVGGLFYSRSIANGRPSLPCSRYVVDHGCSLQHTVHHGRPRAGAGRHGLLVEPRDGRVARDAPCPRELGYGARHGTSWRGGAILTHHHHPHPDSHPTLTLTFTSTLTQPDP